LVAAADIAVVGAATVVVQRDPEFETLLVVAGVGAAELAVALVWTLGLGPLPHPDGRAHPLSPSQPARPRGCRTD
jgi:hypothetical protein